MDIAALETYARDLDVSNCSKPELRRIVAAASSIAARGRAEIKARPCTFPARLAPLVLQWLPLSDVGAALSCSGQWRDTSEWAFQLVAARIGLAHERGVSWRENVKHRLRWIGEASESGSVEVEFTEGLTIDRGYVSPYFVNDQERQLCELMDPKILVTDNKIENVNDLIPLLEVCGGVR